MSTLLAAYDNGTCYGRCDAKCYDAAGISSDACACLCGGVNHGVGMPQALRNTAALAPQWLKRERRDRRSRKVVFETPFHTSPSLFDL